MKTTVETTVEIIVETTVGTAVETTVGTTVEITVRKVMISKTITTIVSLILSKHVTCWVFGCINYIFPDTAVAVSLSVMIPFAIIVLIVIVIGYYLKKS